ncbi:hypothetical protein BD289DRAFT_76153 [Coniella lustricola]|uniref:Uncharacterized protein n=1 Tax=Coniella lustricola TaxID=2025994 RepID=A0A2T2ZZI7_9PEZI|nr:hypothetical protein BD289DRAFT_76153 [Coniella lustricola]
MMIWTDGQAGQGRSWIEEAPLHQCTCEQCYVCSVSSCHAGVYHACIGVKLSRQSGLLDKLCRQVSLLRSRSYWLGALQTGTPKKWPIVSCLANLSNLSSLRTIVGTDVFVRLFAHAYICTARFLNQKHCLLTWTNEMVRPLPLVGLASRSGLLSSHFPITASYGKSQRGGDKLSWHLWASLALALARQAVKVRMSFVCRSSGVDETVLDQTEGMAGWV